MNKKKIGVDVDEVLFPFTDNLLIFYNKKHNANVKKEDIYVYEFYKVLGISKEKEMDDIKEFLNSPLFKEMKPIEGAVEGIKELRENNELYIVTGRSSHTKETTYHQIISYFNDRFKEIHLSEFNPYIGFKTPKFQFCKQIGIELMIEDIASTALEISKQCNIPVIMPNYPWNKNANLDETKVKRVEGWKGIIEEARKYI